MALNDDDSSALDVLASMARDSVVQRSRKKLPAAASSAANPAVDISAFLCSPFPPFLTRMHACL